MENGEQKEVIRFAEFEFDAVHRVLRREGKSLALNAKTFDLLAFLLENNGRIVTKGEILEAVWAGQFVEEANLSVQVSALRKVFGETKTSPRLLLTIPGVGYKFVADVQKEDDEIIIEKHRFERIAVGEEIDAAQYSEPKQLTAGKRRHRPVIFAVAGLALSILLAFVGYRYFYVAPKTQIDSLAVLPFVNQNNDPNTEYLSDGLAESVIYSLSGLPDLRLMSRSSSFRYKEREADAKSIGKELNVQAVLTGRIALLGDNLTVSTELVSTADNSVIWGEQFTRKMSDIEKLQTDIARSISQKLRIKLAGADEGLVKKNNSEDPEVYRLYLLGRYHLNKLTDDGFRKGRDYFAAAIEKDPQYALAYAGLAEAYNRLCGYNALSPNEGFPKARTAAARALELDDQLAEAHATLGAVKHFYDWDWTGAEKEFKRALEINPNNADAHQLYSYHLTGMGRFDESLVEMRRAQELDPLSIEKITGIGEILNFQRQPDLALEQYQKALEMDPNLGFTHWAIGNAYVQKRMYAEAIAEYQKSIPLSGDSPDEPASLAYAYALSGKRQEAVAILEDLKERSTRQYISPTIIAVIYGALGEKDEAFEWLEKAYNARDFILTLLKVEPMFDPLRDDARFPQLMRRVGLLS